MLESLMQLRRRCLQLHSRPQAVRRAGAPADKAVNRFLNVDERLFQSAPNISSPVRRRKPCAEVEGLWASTGRA